MTLPCPSLLQPIGAMSSSRVFLGELLSSRARLRFSGYAQPEQRLPLAKEIPANGTQGLLSLSHSRGSLHGLEPVWIGEITHQSLRNRPVSRGRVCFAYSTLGCIGSSPGSSFRGDPRGGAKFGMYFVVPSLKWNRRPLGSLSKETGCGSGTFMMKERLASPECRLMPCGVHSEQYCSHLRNSHVSSSQHSPSQMDTSILNMWGALPRGSGVPVLDTISNRSDSGSGCDPPRETEP